MKNGADDKTTIKYTYRQISTICNQRMRTHILRSIITILLYCTVLYTVIYNSDLVVSRSVAIMPNDWLAVHKLERMWKQAVVA